MKRAVLLLSSLLLLLGSSVYGKHSIGSATRSQGDSLIVLSSPELNGLSTKWAVEYNKLFPGSNIKIVSVTDPDKAGSMIKGGAMGFIANDDALLKNQPLWSLVVGRDVIVPVINAGNPFMAEIELHGISPELLAASVRKGGPDNWGSLLKNDKNVKADFYCINDDATIKSLAGFFRADVSTFSGMKKENSAELVAAIQNDPYAIGFCKLVNVLDFQNQKMVGNVMLLPIDKNGNGTIDYNEKIYDDLNNFSRGVWIGKYPKSLICNIYTIASAQPENVNEVAFIKWVLSDGQKYLSGSGYSELLANERQSATDKFYSASIYAGASSVEKSFLKSVLFIIATVILIGAIVTALSRRRKKGVVNMSAPHLHSVLNENSLSIPKGIYFDKTHTWAFLQENGVVKVGIDDFLQHITGKITRIKMKGTGKKVKKGEQILSIIQNGKQLNLYAPVSGTIVEQNMALEDNSSALNSSPYKDGWIYKIEPSNWSRENQLLFMADKQREFIKKEFTRMKDFLMAALSTDPNYAQLILQDGGEISDGVLSEMGPEVWEDFQTNFIDPSKQVWFYEMF